MSLSQLSFRLSLRATRSKAAVMVLTTAGLSLSATNKARSLRQQLFVEKQKTNTSNENVVDITKKLKHVTNLTGDADRQEKIENCLKLLSEKLRDNCPKLLSREFKSGIDLTLAGIQPNPARQFRIMQWNALSKTLFDVDNIAPHVSTKLLNWSEFRMWRVLEELVRYNCDLICIQEADFYDDIRGHLEQLGYRGVLCQNYTGFNKKHSGEGLAVFYNRNTFEMTQLKCQNIDMNSEKRSQQAFMMLQLEHKVTRKRLTLLNTHLKVFHQFKQKRHEQTKFLLDQLKAQLNDESATSMNDDLSRRHAVLFCGDLNGQMGEDFYDLIVDDKQLKFKDAYSANKQEIYLSNHQDNLNINPSKLLSKKNGINLAFAEINNQQTNSGRIMTRKFVDYIFYTRCSLKLVNYLSIDSKCLKSYIPNLSYPSDHFSLIVDFQFE